MLFGSIVVYQILAHFPLANIALPANSLQAFANMISVVSFDYFPIFDHWDVGFTETNPRSERFEWLGYESVNFLEGMGSISIFASIILLYMILIIMIKPFRCYIKTGSMISKITDPMKVWLKSVAFV